MEEGRSAFKILARKHTGKRFLRSPRHRWGNNIRIGLKEIDFNVKNWIDSAQDSN
jgi:hypothetical protein